MCHAISFTHFKIFWVFIPFVSFATFVVDASSYGNTSIFFVFESLASLTSYST